MQQAMTIDFYESAIDNLYNTIGLKESFLLDDIYSSYRIGGMEGLCRKIAHHLGLKINFNITYVTGSEFKTKQLNTKSEGDSGICAQVTIPNDIDKYNFQTIEGYIISIMISENVTEDLLGFSVVLAHELSHIVLYLTKHTQRENEYYTDLTAMMYGFTDVFYQGRQKKETTTTTEYGFFSKTYHTQTKTLTYGYLDDKGFEYSFNKIKNLLKYDKEQRILINKLSNKLESMMNKIKIYIPIFNKSLNNISKKLSQDDMIHLKKYYDIEYIQSYEAFNYKINNIIKQINELLIKDCKTKKGIHVITESITNIEIFTEKVKQKQLTLRKDIITINLSKYKNPFIRFFKYIFFAIFY